MAKKQFKTHNPNDKLVDNKPMEDQIELAVEQPEEEQKPAEEPKAVAVEPDTQAVPKRKAGRPKTKTEPERYINISVPVLIMDKLDTVKPCFGGNLTAYINRLIVKDLEENYDKYMEFMKLL